MSLEISEKNDASPFAIRLSNITKAYGNVLAIAGISLEIKQGEVFGLLGPNGAGKTTTLRIIKGMIKPTSGIVEVLGRKSDKDINWIKQHTGYLPEEGSLLGRLTPLELCEFIGGLFGIPAKNSRQRALEFFQAFDLLEKKDTLIEKLSRGMKQKLSLICSIIHDPEVILMDEPLASLDPLASRNIKEFIKYLSKEKKKTILISSHRLSLVEDVSDRVAIIHKGAILDVGTPNVIMAKTGTTTLEDAYLAIVPGYKKPIFQSDGSIVEAEQAEKANLKIKMEKKD